MKVEHHVVPGDTAPQVEVHAMGQQQPGGDFPVYMLEAGPFHCVLNFQAGPIKEVGQNGVTAESLVAIAIHRLECFQEGPFACQENADALEALRTALNLMQKRTRDRIARQVEGTMQK